MTVHCVLPRALPSIQHLATLTPAKRQTRSLCKNIYCCACGVMVRSMPHHCTLFLGVPTLPCILEYNNSLSSAHTVAVPHKYACSAPNHALVCMRNTRTNLAGTSKNSVEECTLDDWRAPLQGLATRAGRTERAVVALGKFDALHKGHRCGSVLYVLVALA